METLLKSFDRYARKARVLPAALVLLPVILSLFTWVPEAKTLSLGAWGAVGWFGLTFTLSQVARHFGKAREKKLWRDWGGAPTTRYLRHRNGEFNAIRRTTCHRILGALVPDLEMPAAGDEKADPNAADERYEACTRFLIRKTRNTDEYPLVFKELINYGFLRNWLGMKGLGVALACIGGAGCGWRTWTVYETTKELTPMGLVGTGLCLGLLVAYLWLSPSAVKVAAEAYTERLLEACEEMDPGRE